MLFDTHAHYDDEAFEEDRIELLDSFSDITVINPGCDIESSLKAMKLAESYEWFHFGAGIHPENLDNLPSDYLNTIETMLDHPKCVAVGEIGLDYYWDVSQKDKQLKVFTEQIELAADMNKPVIIHDREAHGDCLEIVKKFKGIKGVFHCFSGSREMAEELLKLGWYLGFDGPVTYKNARKVLEVLEICPSERILIETDSPYLTPVPKRGQRNDSRNLEFVISRIEEIKGLTNLAEITYYNAKKLFLS